jgi:hypothetical protein
VLSLDLSKAQAKPKLLPCKTPSPIYGHTSTALAPSRILVLGGTGEEEEDELVSEASRHPVDSGRARVLRVCQCCLPSLTATGLMAGGRPADLHGVGAGSE